MSRRSQKNTKATFLDRVKTFTNQQIAIIFSALALVVFFTGLASPFQGDDNPQIIDNAPVHDLKLGEIFSSSTFYNGQDLVGSYYRPLMTTTYAFIYAVFGPHSAAFHVAQLGVYVAAVFMLYLVFKKFFNQPLSLALAAIFMVHPLNSQIVYAIPSMQDALFFFFGILGLWMLTRDESIKGLWLAALCALLAMLSKEVGVVFPIMYLLYLWLFDRKRLKLFSVVVAVPVLLYVALRANAIGLTLNRTYIAPIDHQSLGERLLSMPSIIQFYIIKFLLPWNLGSRYYWTHPTFSVRYFLIPLVVVAAAIGALAYLGVRARRARDKRDFRVFTFFAVWTIAGLLPYLQIEPLDMTASINWFFFPMAGLLGMLAAGLGNVSWPVSRTRLGMIALDVLLVLSVSTAVQGTYYHTPLKLAQHDLKVDDTNYAAMNDIALGLIRDKKYEQAAKFAQRSIAIQPTLFNYQNLGVARHYSGDYQGAIVAYQSALKYGSQASLYEDLALVSLAYGRPDETLKIFHDGLAAYPENFKLWLYLALFEDSQGHNDQAQTAINSASQFGDVPPQLLTLIMNNQAFTLPLPNLNKSLVIK